MAEGTSHASSESDPSIAEIRAARGEHIDHLRLQELRKLADDDQEYQQIRQYVHNGFPQHPHQTSRPVSMLLEHS